MLELRSVDAGYGGFQALFGVSLDVKAGEAVGVIGPNGAGKTTLMRVISGLIRPRAGSLAMEGVDLLATPAHQIVGLGIAHVPENRRLFPRLTVEENLKMGAFMPQARAKFARRLDFVFDLFPRLKERRTQLAGTMSGGEQQMCAIGRALMSDPKLLLLDEPSAGLAPVVVQQVFELVKRIQRAAGAACGRSRLSARGRHHPHLGHVGRDAGERHDQTGLSRCVTFKRSADLQVRSRALRRTWRSALRRGEGDAGIPRHLRHLPA